MNAETLVGSASIATWLEWTVIVSAFILSASIFSRSAPMTRSSLATTNQVGFAFHAGLVIFPVSAAPEVGPWVTASNCFYSRGKS
jgi:hypothetical protein